MSEFKMREGLGADDMGRDLSRALNDAFTRNGPNSLFVTCGNCKHMATLGAAHCTLYNLTPPISVIMTGCPSHVDDQEIPF